MGLSGKTKNFKYLDDLIHSGVGKIVLDFDVALFEGEEAKYFEGIELDVCDVVIDAAGHTIDGCGKVRIFNCISRNITIINAVVKNGFSEESGGAICNTGELVVENCVFSNNNAFCGGAIGNSNKLKITRSLFSGNVVKGKKSAGGAIYNDNGRLDMESSKLLGNLSNWGGAISSEDSLVNVSGCVLSGNCARDGGGAIYVETGDLSIQEFSLSGNTSNLDGGAIWNQSANIRICGSYVTSNKSRHSGGAISSYDGKLEIANSLFSSNYAESGGNAIFINSKDDLILKNCSISEGDISFNGF